MKTMKKVLALLLVVALTATIAVNVTLAYLQDEDEAVNTMTLGNVYIDQIEQERNANGELVDFTQDKPALPAVTEDDSAWSPDTPVQIGENVWANMYGDRVANDVDKIVTVKNTGSTAAYVRTIVAVESVGDSDSHISDMMAGYYTSEEDAKAKADRVPTMVGNAWDIVDDVNIDGTNYCILVATYKDPLAPGATSAPSLTGLALDDSVTNEQLAAYGETLDILVVSQAVQAQGFPDAVTALNAAFGKITTTNHPWIDGIAGGRWDGTADDEGLEENTDTTAKTVSIKTPEQLAAFAESVNSGTSYSGYTVELTANIDLAGKAWTPIGDCNGTTYFQGTFDGNGYTISNLVVNNADTDGNASAGFFGWIDAAGATIQNVTFNNAKVSGHHWVGVAVGYASGVVSGVTVTNSTVIGTHANDNADGDKVGGVVGYTNDQAKLLNNTVRNCTITGNRDVGGITGGIAASGTMTGNHVENTTIVYETAQSYASAGEIVSGRTGFVPDATNTASNVTISMIASAADNNGLDAAIASGATTIELGSGTYIVPDSAQGKTLTIIGNGDTVIATQDDGSYEGCDYSLDGSTVTFENITINTDSSTYTGYARMKGTYNNCTINGTYTLYGDSVFNDCTFNVTGDVYNIWTWGANNATFNNCTFNSDGKAMLLYSTVNTNLTIDGCTFNDNGGLSDLKAAIEIGNDYGVSYNLIVNDTVVNGYEINDKGINTGTTLWGNKNSMGTDKLNVVVDGVDVY